MTTKITFDTLELTLSGSMANFPNGYPIVLNRPSTVYDSNARIGGIIVTDQLNSAPFTATYTIFGGRTQYDSIKAKEGATGILEIDVDSIIDTIPNVSLLAVSGPSQRGSVITCTLLFNLTREN